MKPQKMSWEIFLKIVDELEEYNYQGLITMQGLNEPFLDERIEEMCGIIRAKLPESKINIISNGKLLNAQKVYSIIDKVDYLQINNYNDELILNKNIWEIEQAVSSIKYTDKIKINLRKENDILSQIGVNECGRHKHTTIDCSCLLPFSTISILPSGKVNLCISDLYGLCTVGDLQKDTLLSIWYGKKIDYFRKKIALGRENIQLCEHCDMF